MRILPLVLAVGLTSPLPAQTFTVGSASAARGTTAYGSIAVPALADSATTLPIAVINGAQPGPVVAFVAGSHGTEYASIVALTRLIERIEPAQLKGTVIVAPLLNLPSFEHMIVHVNPVDGKGMNSSYPGNAAGTQTERALAAFVREVVDRADVVIDLHGGDLDESLRPYSYWIRGGNAAKDSAALQLALAFGLDVVIVRDMDPTVAAQTRSLSGYSIARGKTTLVAEAGRSGLVLPEDVTALVDGSLNVLGSLGLLPRQVQRKLSPTFVDAGARVTASSAGMFYATVARGERVQAEQIVGYTTDYLGRKTSEVRAPAEGMVTFIRGVPSMWTGATLVAVSRVLRDVPAWKKPGT